MSLNDDFEVSMVGPGWIDIESQGELYRFYTNRRIVIGPDGTEYDADGWLEEWGYDEDDILKAVPRFG